MVDSTSSYRKLPRSMRFLNMCYQILPIFMCGLNTVLVTLNSSNTLHVPVEYFECYAVIINILPIIWSKILDETKTYMSSFTPPLSPEAQCSALSPTLQTNLEAEVIAPEMSTPESYPDRSPPHLDS